MKRSGYLKRKTGLSPRRKGTFKHKAWSVFSRAIRKRDADENGMVACFTCGAVKHFTELDCGHYIPKSISLALRFDERNNHPQCVGCNQFRHGNLTQYALALKRKYGESILEELDRDRRLGEGFRISEAGYQEIYEKYRVMGGE